MRELRRCSVIVACALSPEEARRAAAAHRPWVALVERDVDRYAYGCLPRLGVGNVLYVGEDGSVPGTLRDRLVAVLDPASASSLARRLPPLRASLHARLEHEAMRDAALAGLARADTETLLAAIAGPVLWQARARGARRTQLYAPAVAAAAATASVDRLLASSPRLARAAGAAACAWAGGRVASLMQGTR